MVLDGHLVLYAGVVKSLGYLLVQWLGLGIRVCHHVLPQVLIEHERLVADVASLGLISLVITDVGS